MQHPCQLDGKILALAGHFLDSGGASTDDCMLRGNRSRRAIVAAGLRKGFDKICSVGFVFYPVVYCSDPVDDLRLRYNLEFVLRRLSSLG